MDAVGRLDGPSSHEASSTGPRSTSLVLLVEDEPDTAATIRSCLQVAGYHTLWAASGDGALAHLEEINQRGPGANRPCVALVDWRLPRPPQGAALVARLRAACGNRLPIVVISADPAALAEARDCGVEDYLPKPFLLEDLIHVVDEHAR